MKKNKQKIIIYFLIISFITNGFSIKVNAETMLSYIFKQDKYLEPTTRPSKQIDINAKAAVIMDSKTKVVLYEKNAETIIPMASTTKIITSLVTINYGNLDNKITISKKAASIGGSTVGYKEGEVVTIKELLYGLMFRSGNDAAIALAEGIGGDVDGFLKLMNEYAVEIGALNSHFESPHGLDSENHYCTAYDLALITAKAKENKIFDEIVSQKSVDGSEMHFTRSYNNINKILFQIPGANGVKTGYTGGAGKCLVSSVDVNGHDVIYVVLNCGPRWKETAKMHQYVLKNYTYKKFFSKDELVKEQQVNKNVENLKIVAPKDIELPVENGKEYKTKVILPEKIKKSVTKGEQIGKLELYKDGECIYSEALIAGNSIK